jgi:stage III sporulation protein AH
MNKKNLWFLTLFSLVLVLSIYYVTMPNDLLAATATTNTSNKKTTETSTTTEESDAISALKVENDAKNKDTLSELQEKLTQTDTTTEEKNKVYEEIKTLNTNSGLEDSIEEKVKKEYNCETFAKIEDTSIKVVVDGCENSKTLANNIMRLVQEQFNEKKYISVKFES